MNTTIAICLSACMLGGCATAFTGSAHIDNGRQGCEAKCRSAGMELAGMVYMGEYTSGCVCAVPKQTASDRQLFIAATNSAAAAAAGVAIQMRRQQQQRQTTR